MRKITLLMLLLLCSVTAMWAQEPITISADSPLSQPWTSDGTTYAPWGNVITEYPQGITPSSGNEVHMATTNVTVSETGLLKFTFQWTTGAHRLNILGVDLLNADNEVVANDYHNGQTGGSNRNNVYTFVANGGSYTLRYFVEHNTTGNDLTKTNGTITGTLTTPQSVKDAKKAEVATLYATGMFKETDKTYIETSIDNYSPKTVAEFTELQNITNKFIEIINGRYFKFKTIARDASTPRYLGVQKNTPSDYNVVTTTDENAIDNIWKLEYVSENKFRLLNIAYNTYSKTTNQTVLAGNGHLKATTSQDEAGLFFINPKGSLIALGTEGGDYSYIHDPNWGNKIMTRWEANDAASQWQAISIDEPSTFTITYKHIFDDNVFVTEIVRVFENSNYTFVNNVSKVGLRLTSDIPAAKNITEDVVVEYEYELDLPFKTATITSENRLAQGSKLYKIDIHEGKKVQLNTDGTGFDVNKDDATIENKLFALTGTVFENFQMFNYAAGLDKPIWAENNNSQTNFVPTAGATGKLELMMFSDNNGEHWSFRKSGTNAYINDFGNGNKFQVWNDGNAHKGSGSWIVFTEATDKEISIATLNLDIKAATPYLTEASLDATIKTNLQNVITEANTAITDEASTAEQLNEIDARLYQLTKDAANDLVVTNADGFKNNGIYTFESQRGWLIYASENPTFVASTKKYSSLETGGDKAYCQWAMHKSVNTGSFYMFNIGANKFVGDSDDNIPFVETPTNDIKILAGGLSGYPIMIATNTSSVINHFNNSNPPGVANWSGGQGSTNDPGNCHVVTKVGFVNDETLANIADLIDVYEAYINKPNLLTKIEELTSFKESSFLTEEDKAAIATAITEAQAVYDNPKYSTVAAKIAELDALKKQLQYIWNTENLSNNVCYAVPTESLGSWVAEDRDNGTRLNSTTKLGTTHDITNPDQQFAFVKSANTNNYYLYSVGKEKFVKKDGEYTLLTESPEQTISFLNGTRNSEYPWVVALNINANSQSQLCVSNGYTPAVVTNWNDTADPGNTVRIEFADTFDPADALAKINAYETSEKKTELQAKITEAQGYTSKTYLGETNIAAITAAINTAQGVYDAENCTYEDVEAQIATLTNILNTSVYVTKPDDFNNNAIYTIVAKYNNGNAYVMYDATQGDNGNYAISSSKNFGEGVTIATGENVPGCQWALYTSSNGNHYLYNIGAGKFMGTSNTGNGYIPLNEKPTSADLIFKNSADSEYPIMFSVNNGAGVLNHNNGNNFPYGLLNWHSTAGWNDTATASNVHKVTVVGALEEETLATIAELVENFETVGLKQLELKSLLDDIHSGYFDNGANNWRINPGVNNYSQQEGDEDFVEAYNDARTYETSENIETIDDQIARMNALVANLTINQPEQGKYYRIRCTINGMKYLSSNTDDNGRMQMTSGTDQSNLFYYTNDGLISYNKGVYIYAEGSSNQIKLRDIAKTSTVEFIDGKDNNKSGSYIIFVKNSEADGGRYIYGKNNTTDSGKNKPENGSDYGYNWWLEEVTELPVTISAAGYASFYAPVAVSIPSGIEAHYLTKIVGNYASMTKIENVIPKNTGVMLTGANGEPATAETYNFTIADDVDAIEGNMFSGTVATEYVACDAYVLANGDNGVGLYAAMLNKENDSAFQNNSHKAYLPMSVLPSGAQASAGLRFDFGGTTAIEEVVVENNENVIYDLQGRRVSEITKAGIYIINGHKVFVK